MLLTSSRASRSESKQDGAELTTSDPSHQNVTNLHRKNSNHLTSAVFLLQTLSPCNNLTSLSADSPEHLWCVVSKQWENPFLPTWKWPWISNFSLGFLVSHVNGCFSNKMISTPIEKWSSSWEMLSMDEHVVHNKDLNTYIIHIQSIKTIKSILSKQAYDFLKCYFECLPELILKVTISSWFYYFLGL